MPPPIRSRRPAPPPAPVAVKEETAPDQEAHHHRRNSLPKDSITIVCVECGKDRTLYVDEASVYDEAARKEMFDRHGSYKPPLCGFCFRKRARLKRMENAA